MSEMRNICTIWLEDDAVYILFFHFASLSINHSQYGNIVLNAFVFKQWENGMNDIWYVEADQCCQHISRYIGVYCFAMYDDYDGRNIFDECYADNSVAKSKYG